MMINPSEIQKFETDQAPTWCPGCGDFAVWRALKMALAQNKFEPHSCVVVFDIGCAGNMADKLKAYCFHGLHGRALPLAEGIKLANHHLPVIVIGGDGGGYGEGLSHFLHSLRGNHDLTYIVETNSVYGLTKGQTAPTSPEGFRSSSTPDGVIEQPINPIALAIAGGATFVARGFASEVDHLTDIITNAIQHRGFALVDVFQPCVTFNHLNTYEWYRQRVYKLEDEGYKPVDREKAFHKAQETEERVPIGIFYQKEERPAYHEKEPELAKTALTDAPIDAVDITPLLQEFF